MGVSKGSYPIISFVHLRDVELQLYLAQLLEVEKQILMRACLSIRPNAIGISSIYCASASRRSTHMSVGYLDRIHASFPKGYLVQNTCWTGRFSSQGTWMASSWLKIMFAGGNKFSRRYRGAFSFREYEQAFIRSSEKSLSIQLLFLGSALHKVWTAGPTKVQKLKICTSEHAISTF